MFVWFFRVINEIERTMNALIIKENFYMHVIHLYINYMQNVIYKISTFIDFLLIYSNKIFFYGEKIKSQ